MRRPTKVLIIGGGPTALRMVKELKQQRGLNPSQIAVVDPASDFLASMRRTVQNTGATHLFSNIYESTFDSPVSESLARFINAQHREYWQDRCEKEAVVGGSGGCGCGDSTIYRPMFADFWPYALSEAAKVGFKEVLVNATVSALQPQSSGRWLATLDNGQEIEAETVIAAGAGTENVFYPDWTQDLANAGLRAKFEHVLSPRANTDALKNMRVGIIGGGMSGCGLALKLVKQGCQVTLVSSHPPVTAKSCVADTFTDWDSILKLHQLDITAREQEIAKARINGAVTQRVKTEVEKTARDRQALVCVWNGVQSVSPIENGIRLQTSQGKFDVDYVVLATGLNGNFRTTHIYRLLERTGIQLPVTNSGSYPILDKNCRWGAGRVPNLHVVGPFSDLAVGPNAGLLAGMNLAAKHAIGPALARI